MKEQHPFDNGGAASGTCRVCGEAVPEHETIKLRDGVEVRVAHRPGLVEVFPPGPVSISWACFIDTNGDWWEVRGDEMKKIGRMTFISNHNLAVVVMPRCATCKWYQSELVYATHSMECKHEAIGHFLLGWEVDGFYPSGDFGCVHHQERS